MLKLAPVGTLPFDAGAQADRALPRTTAIAIRRAHLSRAARRPSGCARVDRAGETAVIFDFVQHAPSRYRVGNQLFSCLENSRGLTVLVAVVCGFELTAAVWRRTPRNRRGRGFAGPLGAVGAFAIHPVYQVVFACRTDGKDLGKAASVTLPQWSTVRRSDNQSTELLATIRRPCRTTGLLAARAGHDAQNGAGQLCSDPKRAWRPATHGSVLAPFPTGCS